MFYFVTRIATCGKVYIYIMMNKLVDIFGFVQIFDKCCLNALLVWSYVDPDFVYRYESHMILFVLHISSKMQINYAFLSEDKFPILSVIQN